MAERHGPRTLGQPVTAIDWSSRTNWSSNNPREKITSFPFYFLKLFCATPPGTCRISFFSVPPFFANVSLQLILVRTRKAARSGRFENGSSVILSTGSQGSGEFRRVLVSRTSLSPPALFSLFRLSCRRLADIPLLTFLFYHSYTWTWTVDNISFLFIYIYYSLRTARGGAFQRVSKRDWNLCIFPNN